jgi:hypothetical protein
VTSSRLPMGVATTWSVPVIDPSKSWKCVTVDCGLKTVNWQLPTENFFLMSEV